MTCHHSEVTDASTASPPNPPFASPRRACVRTPPDIASPKQLEEFKRRKQAKGAALRAQFLEGSDGGAGGLRPPPSASVTVAPDEGPPSPAASDYSTVSEASRSKYQDRLEARLQSVLGDRGGGGANQADPENNYVEERREKAMTAGAVLSAELAAARADIAAAKDLAAGATPATPNPAKAPEPSSPHNHDAAHAKKQAKGAALREHYLGGGYSAGGGGATLSDQRQQHSPGGGGGGVGGEDPAHLHELRDRLRAEHTELARLRGELATLRTQETSRDVEIERLRLSENAARDEL